PPCGGRRPPAAPASPEPARTHPVASARGGDPLGREGGRMPDARNVLLVTVDQWRGDSLSCAGHPLLTTPAIDALAAGGVLFSNHWANAAPCGPSRACIYTGMYLHNHRSVLNGTPLDARFTNVALEARAAGHDPVLFGYTDTSV